MTKLVFDTLSTRLGLPTWRVEGSQYPGEVSFEGTPYRGTFKSWLKGVNNPLENFETSTPPTWEDFLSMTHYQSEEGIISVSGFFADLVDKNKVLEITDEAELRTLFEGKVRRSRTTEVSERDRTVVWSLGGDDHPGAMVWFSRFWIPSNVVEDDEQRISVVLRPTLAAQLRHLFSLKPWKITICAPQTA
jgi:hypothetical protein